MKICIFGGQGFIGSALAKRCKADNFDVDIFTQGIVNKKKTISVNKKIYKIKYNEKNFKKIIKKKYDQIFFFSGNSNQETSKNDIYFDLNMTFLIFTELLEAARKSFYKGNIWFASSVVVYGEKNKKLSENTNCSPISFYAFAKYISEILCSFYVKNFKLNIGILRIFSTYGPGLKRQVVFDIINKIKSGKNFNLFGTGKEKRDFSFIDDQVNSIFSLMLSLKKPKNDIYNIASGKGYSIKNILDELIKISKFRKKIKFMGTMRNFDTRNFIADIKKLKNKISYKQTSLKAGLKLTFDSIIH